MSGRAKAAAPEPLPEHRAAALRAALAEFGAEDARGFSGVSTRAILAAGCGLPVRRPVRRLLELWLAEVGPLLRKPEPEPEPTLRERWETTAVTCIRCGGRYCRHAKVGIPIDMPSLCRGCLELAKP